MGFDIADTRIAPVLLVAALLAGAAPAEGQRAEGQPGPRVATVLAGVGNSLGWFGGAAEVYFAGGRLSAFLGAGYTPATDIGQPLGLTGAVGFRGFTPGQRHRAFIELSWSQILVETKLAPAAFPDPDYRETSGVYGPGLLAGYQYAAPGGFTVMVSGGVGAPGGAGPLAPSFNLGVGYTWRR